MSRELDDRQEHLQKVDTLRTRPGPFWVEPPRHQRPSRWERAVARVRGWIQRASRRP